MNKHLPIIVIILISLIFISLMYIGNFTGFAPGDPTPPSTNTESSPELPSITSCLDLEANEKCGQPCWLVSNGNPQGTYDSSSGKIGVVSWNGNCQDVFIFQSSDQPMCCGECDCPLNSICNQGECNPIEIDYGIMNIPLDGFTGNAASKCRVYIYNNNIHNGNNVVKIYEGYELTGSKLQNQLKSGEYRVSIYSLKSDGSLGAKFYEDIKIVGGKISLADKFNSSIYTTYC